MRRDDARGGSGTLLAPGLGWLVAASFLFGVMAVAVRLAASEMPAMQVAFFRFAGSLAIMLAATRGRGLRPRDGNLVKLLARGLIGATAIVLYFLAIGGAGAGLAALLQSVYPVCAALLGALLLGERFTARLAIALALSVAGAAAVFGAELRVDPAARSGMLCALAAAVLSGGAVVTARHLRHTENASLITTYFMAVGAAVTAPSLLAGVPAADPRLVAALVAVVLTSVAAQWLLHHGLGFVSAAQGSLVAATGVVSAAGLEALWFGEPLRAAMLGGGGLMIAAVGLAWAETGALAVPGAADASDVVGVDVERRVDLVGNVRRTQDADEAVDRPGGDPGDRRDEEAPAGGRHRPLASR